MELIDDEGRIFGTINIIDALVILLVLAVVVAGFALVTSSGQQTDGPDTAVRYATLDLGTQPNYLADQIREGDIFEPNDNSNLTITDQYATPEGNAQHIFLRVRLEGVVENDGITYNDGPPRLGRELTITTPKYKVAGQIVSVSETDPELPLTDIQVLLETTLSGEDADQLEAGDTIRSSHRTIAEIEDILYYETDNPNEQRAIVLTSLLAYESQDGLQFGGTPLRTGETVELLSANYDISGTILEKRSNGIPTQKTDVLLRMIAPTETTSQISVGDRYNISGQSVADIQAVDAYGTGNPDQKLVYVGVQYLTYHPRVQPQFAGQIVSEGETLQFKTDTYQFEGRVHRMKAVELRGRQTTRTVTIELEGVDPEVANRYRQGMDEVVRGETIARLESVSVEPSKMVLTSQEGEVFLRNHPIEKDVTITAEIRVRQTVNAIRFKGETLRQGQTITLDLGTATLRGTVTGIE